MTYCIGVMLDKGMIFASDSRTNAGMDNIAKFCKMTVFKRRGDRVLVLLSSGNLAGTQAVIGVLPTWPHARTWGYGPSGIVGVIVLILIVLFLMGRL